MTEKILDKIRKLQDHAESAKAIGSEAEAQAFADRVQQMMLQHNITEAQISTARSKSQLDEEAVMETFHPSDHGWKFKRTHVEWELCVAQAVAYANFCEVLSYQGCNAMAFIGFKHNVDVCLYMYEVLVKAADRLADAAYGEEWRRCEKLGDVTQCRGFRQSFLTGFVLRLLNRIYDQRDSQVKETGSLAIVVVDKAQSAIDKLKEKIKPKKRTASEAKANNARGFIHGQMAADKVNLGQKAVGESKPEKPKGELN